jgi:biotin carboxyl carrier protein
VQYDVEVNGQRRQVQVTRHAGRFLVEFGGRQWAVDAAAVGHHFLSLLIDTSEPAADLARSDGAEAAASGVVQSREIAIATDPVSGQFVFGVGAVSFAVGLNTRRRFGRQGDEGTGGSGPQRLLAPMPGKVVRLLGKAGDTVQPRQAVVVIEAMKMENELRASRDGVITDVLVQEGQSVDAGTLLAVISPA